MTSTALPARTAAVIGCGDVSVVHLEAVAQLPGVDLVAVCDLDPATASTVAARYGVPAFADHRVLLDRLRPDVVHIATPHDTHAAIAVDCLDAGVHVIMEKPVAHTRAAADPVIEAAANHPDTKIAVCFQNRYNTAVQAARTLIDSGEVGAVLGGTATVMWHRTPAYYRARPWRGQREHSGGGALINQAIHTLDLLQWFGGEVTTVRGHADNYTMDGEIDVEDTAHVILQHASGARSAFFATNAAAIDSPVTLEIVTEQAVLFVRGDLTVTYADGRIARIEETKGTSSGRAYWGTSHRRLIEDFYRRLDDPEPFWISPAEAAKSLRILEAVYDQSAGR